MMTLAAKELGRLAMPGACGRCFWLRKHAGKLLPFQHFAGVFATLDRLSKDAAYALMALGSPVPWLQSYGRIVGFLKPPHWSKFHFTHGGIQIRGEADMILKLEGGGLMIPDLKTAMLTAKQDELLPIYRVQLNAYALCAESTGLGDVKKLGIFYCQPQEAQAYISGYHVTFVVQAVEVHRDDASIRELCTRAASILTGPLPDPTPSCEECNKLAGLLSILNSGVAP